MPSVMAGRRVCDGRQPALAYQALVCFRPGWDRSVVGNPMGVRSFVTPFHKARHNFRVRPGATKRPHTPLAFPHRQSPECAARVYKKSPTEEPRRPHGLALRKKSLPHERRNMFHGANAKASDGGQHSSLILAEEINTDDWSFWDKTRFAGGF
jgi:hypothetical protein